MQQYFIDQEVIDSVTFVDVIKHYNAKVPDKEVLIFLDENEQKQESFTYKELDKRARTIANALVKKNAMKERVVLLYEPGLEFIAAFLGCLYAGAIAVPTYPPDPNRLNKSLPRLVAIIKDCEAKFALTSSKMNWLFKAFRYFPVSDSHFLRKLKLIVSDKLKSKQSEEIYKNIDEETIAFLQYTSGSTGSPKGVILTHRNLLENNKAMNHKYFSGPHRKSVFWVPLYHDMGLVGTLQHLFCAAPIVFTSPITFLKKPLSWIRALSRYGATHTAVPNFALEFTACKANKKDLEGVDLSSLEFLLVGAEPIRKQSMDKFYEVFSSYGFKYEAFYPAYGLAEATTLACGNLYFTHPKSKQLDSQQLKQGKVAYSKENTKNSYSLVSCGTSPPNGEIIIVAPDSCHKRQANEIGEIWINAPYVSDGYWQKPELTAEIFQATTPDEPNKKYLRTGDLGFLDKDDWLFIAGRIKELMIIRGRNYYPQDIEYTCEQNQRFFSEMRRGCCAAFTIEKDSRELLVIFQEINTKKKQNASYKELFEAIVKSVADEHGISVHAIFLLQKGALPKTSSGKIIRYACKDIFKNNFKKSSSKILQTYFAKRIFITEKKIEENSEERSKLYSDNNDISLWLQQKMAELAHIPIEQININAPLSQYGLDSQEIVSLTAELEKFIGKPVSATAVFGSESLADLALHFSLNSSQNSGQQVNLTKTAVEKNTSCPVAIIGMSAVFPMAQDIEQFWHNLAIGKDCISEIPRERWDWRDIYGRADEEGDKTDIKWGGFIDDLSHFDPIFFGISPREAKFMDPQQRLLLMHTWKALEDAGYSGQSLSGSNTGVFIGIGNNGYGRLISEAGIAMEGHSATGVVPSVGPNRISYFLNINGPSEALETACSSSLVAVHRAVATIQNGECEMAIVGGVHGIVIPEAHIAFNKAGMLCKDGRCKSFSDQANGYVRSEGAGVLVLKDLALAKKAEDHIYGVILSSAENHSGRANSLTAPNPKAQAQLLQTAYTKANIDPYSVSYIEAHGTGTPLGDPIEIEGIKTAFQRLSQANTEVSEPSCGLGSVKSNIGHLEVASGVAGIIKVLLQIKHKTLVKSLHCSKINPRIELEGTPFYIVQQKQEWKALHNIHGEELPRLAGVSSFGFGGTNAHVVIEEYIDNNRRQAPIINNENPAIVILSAKKEKQLLKQAQLLLKAIENAPFGDKDLPNIVYTLQLGRQALEERLAIIVSSIAELKEALRNFVAGKKASKNLYRGHAKRHREILDVFVSDQDTAKALELWIDKKKYTKIANLWTKGLNFDWDKLYGEMKPYRISLPTYPFAKERFWPDSQHKNDFALTKKNTLHPLLHENNSTLQQQRFSSLFTGAEFFLYDHIVMGKKIMPAVTYLEMARIAGKLAAGREITTFKNVVWGQPIDATNEMQTVEISLSPTSKDVSYKVYDGKNIATIYSQGKLQLQNRQDDPPRPLDLEIIRKRCSNKMDQQEIYRCFAQLGIIYGIKFQSLVELESNEQEVCGKWFLPQTMFASKENFVLHPSVMDGALQAIIGLIQNTSQNKMYLPFSLKRMDIWNSTPTSGYVHVLFCDMPKNEELVKFNITITDDKGNICVALQELVMRAIPSTWLKNAATFQEQEVQSKKNKEISEEKTFQNSTSQSQKIHSAQVEEDLIEMAVGMLHLNREDFDVESHFEEFGLDSILMMRMLNELENKYNCSISPTALIDCPDIRSLAQYLIEEEIAVEKTVDTLQEENGLFQEENGSLQKIKQETDSITKLHLSQAITGSRFLVPENTKSKTGKIAIIGQACRLPQSPNMKAFWTNLAACNNLITEIPEERWDKSLYYGSEHNNIYASYSKHGGFLDHISYFDAQFFGISDREAVAMDPQQRIILELTQELLDSAGYHEKEVKGSLCSVIIGAKDNFYSRIQPHLIAPENFQHSLVNSISNMIAARISDHYDLHGISKTIDTACSSSLVAVHEGCESILQQKSELVIAGGVFLMIDPSSHIGFAKAQVLSPDGKSYVFDERANGFVLGEGAGLVLLKDYDKAIADGDKVFGIILGSAVNNDGKTAGVTVPNLKGQKKVIERALQISKVHPEEIGYYEAHGTGTLLGDPIEIKAATEVYRQHTQKTGFCAVGSVKSNLGHTMTVAGVASLLKVLLSLQHKAIPATLHCQKPHPRFRFEQSPFYPNQKLQPWPSHWDVRRAALSSFGFGGTNCHMILEAGLQESQRTARTTSFNKKHYWLGQPVVAKEITRSVDIVKDVQSYLQDKMSSVLGIEKKDVPLDDNFMEMGLESFHMLSMVEEVEQELEIELYPTLLFEYQNIEALSGNLGKEHEEAFLRYLAKSGKTQIKSETAVAKITSPLFVNTDNARNKCKDIAIIGMHGYLPQSKDLSEFWQHLTAGRDLVTEVPKSHWDYREWFDEDKKTANKTYCKWGGFLDDIDKFDPEFFSIAPRQAKWIDPQLRLLLQSAYKTFEDAAIINKVRGSKTSVYIGSCFHEYWDEIVRAQIPIVDYQHTSSTMSSLSSSISYFFDLQGESIPVDNACASSLTALHLGIQSLLRGASDIALIGGVNVLLSPLHYVSFSRLKTLSPTGRCRVFDKSADGYVPGEGIVSIVIKKLDQALKDGDNIHAVIKGSAINHGGRSNNYAIPRPELQTKLLLAAWENAQINPEDFSYIETPGTGTHLGDSVEISALRKAFRKYTDKKSFCTIGSVKSHIGHLEAASGLASVAKVVLMMKHGKIPQMPLFECRNPLLQLENSPFVINQQLLDWKNGSKPLLAGVSSFGMTGNNAHVVLEAHAEQRKKIFIKEPFLIVLSAMSKQQLCEQAEQLIDVINNKSFGNNDLANITYTLQVGREAMDERLAFLVDNIGALQDKLKKFVMVQDNIDMYYGQIKEHRDTLEVYTANRNIEETIAEWIKQKEYAKLLSFWSKGLSVDWNKLYGESKPWRISLPTYCFAKKRYWALQQGNEAEETRKSGDSFPLPLTLPLTSKFTLAPERVGYYHDVWEKKQIIANDIPQVKAVLLFSENDTETKAFKDQWPQQTIAPRVIEIQRGEKYLLANDRCLLRAENEDDYKRLLSDLNEQEILIENVIYLCNWSKNFTWEEKSSEDLNKNLLELMTFTKVLLPKRKSKINIVYLYWDKLENKPLAEMLSGFAKSIYLETLQFKFKVIGVEKIYAMEKLISCLPQELQGESSVIEVVYRGKQRWEKSIEEFIIDQNSEKIAVKEKGGFLISGGMGGLGLIFARHLAQKYCGRLVLVGRSALTSSIKQELQEIEKLGGQVMYQQADLQNISQLQEVVAIANKHFGPLNGVIHSAGVVENAFLFKKNQDSFNKTLASKTVGLVNLDLATKEQPLDFFVLFSSIVSKLGNIGQSDYAAANGFMNGYSKVRNQLSLEGKRSGKTWAISWPLWQDGGMKAPEETIKWLNNVGVAPFTREAGIDVFDKSLHFTEDHFMVIAGDQQKIQKKFSLGKIQKAHLQSRQNQSSQEKSLLPSSNSYNGNLYELELDHDFSCRGIHEINDQKVFSAIALAQLVIMAVEDLALNTGNISDMTLSKPLVLENNQKKLVQISLQKEGSQKAFCKISLSSREDLLSQWENNAIMTVQIGDNL